VQDKTKAIDLFFVDFGGMSFKYFERLEIYAHINQIYKMILYAKNIK